MSRATTAFAAALSLLLPIGRPLLVGLTPAIGISAGLLSTHIAYAKTAADWINSAFQKYINGDHKGAITDYTNPIEINPHNANAYANRGILKSSSKDYQ